MPAASPYFLMSRIARFLVAGHIQSCPISAAQPQHRKGTDHPIYGIGVYINRRGWGCASHLRAGHPCPDFPSAPELLYQQFPFLASKYTLRQKMMLFPPRRAGFSVSEASRELRFNAASAHQTLLLVSCCERLKPSVLLGGEKS